MSTQQPQQTPPSVIDAAVAHLLLWYKQSPHALLIDVALFASPFLTLSACLSVDPGIPRLVPSPPGFLFCQYPAVVTAARAGDINGTTALARYANMFANVGPRIAVEVANYYFKLVAPTDPRGVLFLDWLNMRHVEYLCAWQPQTFRLFAAAVYEMLAARNIIALVEQTTTARLHTADRVLDAPTVMQALLVLQQQEQTRPLRDALRTVLANSLYHPVSCAFQTLGADTAARKYVLAHTMQITDTPPPPPPPPAPAPPPLPPLDANTRRWFAVRTRIADIKEEVVEEEEEETTTHTRRGRPRLYANNEERKAAYRARYHAQKKASPVTFGLEYLNDQGGEEEEEIIEVDMGNGGDAD